VLLAPTMRRLRFMAALSACTMHDVRKLKVRFTRCLRRGTVLIPWFTARWGLIRFRADLPYAVWWRKGAAVRKLLRG